MASSKSASRVGRPGAGGATRMARAVSAGGALIAKALVGPLTDLANAGVSAAVAGTRVTASTAVGRQGLDLTLKGVNALLSALPGARPSTLDARELRESFVAAGTQLGADGGRKAVALAEATLRAALGDPELLGREIESGIDLMRQIADGGDSLDVLPGDPVPRELRDSARGIVDREPKKLLAALDGGVPPGSSRAAAIAEAFGEDAENLRHFAIGYPRVLALLAARLGKLLVTDTMSVAEFEAFLRGRRLVGRQSTGRGNDGAPRESDDPGAATS